MTTILCQPQLPLSLSPSLRRPPPTAHRSASHPFSPFQIALYAPPFFLIINALRWCCFIIIIISVYCQSNNCDRMFMIRTAVIKDTSTSDVGPFFLLFLFPSFPELFLLTPTLSSVFFIYYYLKIVFSHHL